MDRCKLLREEAISTARRLRSPGGRLIHAVVCLDFGKSNHPTENVAHFLLFVKLWSDGTDLFAFSLCPNSIQDTPVHSGRPEDSHNIGLWWSWAASFLMLGYYLPFQQAWSFSRFPGKITTITVLARGMCFSSQAQIFPPPCLQCRKSFHLENQFLLKIDLEMEDAHLSSPWWSKKRLV